MMRLFRKRYQVRILGGNPDSDKIVGEFWFLSSAKKERDNVLLRGRKGTVVFDTLTERYVV